MRLPVSFSVSGDLPKIAESLATNFPTFSMASQTLEDLKTFGHDAIMFEIALNASGATRKRAYTLSR